MLKLLHISQIGVCGNVPEIQNATLFHFCSIRLQTNPPNPLFFLGGLEIRICCEIWLQIGDHLQYLFGCHNIQNYLPKKDIKFNLGKDTYNNYETRLSM